MLLLGYLAGVPKSIYVNFRLLPFSVAIKLPIIVSRKTIIRSLSGSAIVNKVRPGIVRIGFGTVETVDYSYNRTIIDISGEIAFLGKCNIGRGSKVMVSGKLTLGEFFMVSADSTIICQKDITIGAHSLIAWGTLLMDSDHHAIYDLQHTQINEDKAIVIGDHVWIGSRAVVLKGSHIANDSIVASSAVVAKQYTKTNVIIAGNPAKVVKENITW